MHVNLVLTYNWNAKFISQNYEYKFQSFSMQKYKQKEYRKNDVHKL